MSPRSRIVADYADELPPRRERPILMRDEMVRAILEGRKTQTRRIVKPQPERNGKCWLWYRPRAASVCLRDPATPKDHPWLLEYCKYGQPGDRLWVRETWTPHGPGAMYRASLPNQPVKWRSSLYMPRRASRILLQITRTRIERLHDIGHDDAMAEGCNTNAIRIGDAFHTGAPRDQFVELWNTINGPQAFDANPWVWVVEFRVLSTTRIDLPGKNA